MIRKSLFILLLLLLGLPSAYGESTEPAAAPGTDKPRAEIAGQSHTFEKVMEGTKVTHDFVIRNTGGSTLDILSVKPG